MSCWTGRSMPNRDMQRNTAMVVTLLTAEDGAQIRITDFAPAFAQFRPLLRPPQLMRIIEPVAGLPRITIRLQAHPILRQAQSSGRWRAQATSPMASRRWSG